MQTKRKLSLSKETLRNLQPTEMRMVAGGISGVACLATELITVSIGLCHYLTNGDTGGPDTNLMVTTSA
jgi:hypothetical protein